MIIIHGDSGESNNFTKVKLLPFCVVQKKKNKFFFFIRFLERANYVRLSP